MAVQKYGLDLGTGTIKIYKDGQGTLLKEKKTGLPSGAKRSWSLSETPPMKYTNGVRKTSALTVP